MVKSLVIGKLIYCLPIYTPKIKNQQSKLHKIIMMSARTIIGNYCFKKSTKYILEKCKMNDITIMIALSSLKLFHKILINKKPKTLLNLLLSQNKRKTDKILRTMYMPKT